MRKIECWKKVLLHDLEYIAGEIKNMAPSPAVILFSGPVGAGKTTFTQTFVRSLLSNKGVNLTRKSLPSPGEDYQEKIQSPSYSIINDQGPVVHADFYRLSSKEEILHLEIPLYLEGKDYFIVEWGRPYLYELQKIIDSPFKFYELQIEMNEGPAGDLQNPISRNFSFYSLD